MNVRKWLARHPKVAPYYTMALGMLTTGKRSQQPSWKAIRKMMVVLATAPRIKHPVLGRIPATIVLPQHKRGSWRDYPHQTIDANLEVQS